MHVSTQTSPPARWRTLALAVVSIDYVRLSEWASGTVWASGPIPGATWPEIPVAGERASKPPCVRGGGKKGNFLRQAKWESGRLVRPLPKQLMTNGRIHPRPIDSPAGEFLSLQAGAVPGHAPTLIRGNEHGAAVNTRCPATRAMRGARMWRDSSTVYRLGSVLRLHKRHLQGDESGTLSEQPAEEPLFLGHRRGLLCTRACQAGAAALAIPGADGTASATLGAAHQTKNPSFLPGGLFGGICHRNVPPPH